jgi:hypothetical protein
MRRPTQEELIERLLRSRLGQEVSLPEIRALGIAQHSARLNAMRKRGLVITNRMERGADGTIHSWYKLETIPTLSLSMPHGQTCAPTKPETLFETGVQANAQYPD